MSDSSERKKGAFLSYVSIIVNTLIQLIYTPLLIKMLSQSEYGLYSLVASIIGYLTVLDFGFGNAIIVYTAKYRAQNKKEEEEKLHGMFKIVFFILGVAAALLAILLFFFVENIFSKTMTPYEIEKMKIMMLILSFNLFLSFSFSIYNSIISAYEKFTFQKIIAILSAILKPILMIPLLFLGFKSITMCIIITIVNAVVVFSNYIYCKKKLKRNPKFKGFDKILFKTILGYSIWIFLGIIVDKVNWSVDQFILGAVSGTIAVSIYSVASTLNQLFMNLSTAISGVFLAKMSKMISNKATKEELTREFIKIGRVQFYIIFFMVSCLVLFGKEFIILWAGKEFEEAYYVSLLLIIPVCIPLIQNLGISIMQAMNKYKFKAISSFIMALINTGISIIFAMKWGARGAALGTCLSLIICNIIIMNIYYKKSIKLDIIEFWKNIVKMFVPLILPFLIIIWIKNSLNLNEIASILKYGIIYTILYTLIAFFGVMNDYEKGFIKKWRKKLHIRSSK